MTHARYLLRGLAMAAVPFGIMLLLLGVVLVVTIPAVILWYLHLKWLYPVAIVVAGLYAMGRWAWNP